MQGAHPQILPWTDDVSIAYEQYDRHARYGRLENARRELRGSPRLERSDVDEWRWMSAHSVTRLPPTVAPAVLRLHFSVATEIVPLHPMVTVVLNGVIIDRISIAEEQNEKTYDVTPAAGGAPNTLELSIDRTLNPARQHIGTDARDLGVLVWAFSFGPA